MISQSEQKLYNRSPSPSPQEQCAKKTHVPVKRKGTVKYKIPSKDEYRFRVCSHPIEEICDETQYLSLLPEEFKCDMLKFICQEGLKGPSVYGEYPAPPKSKTVEMINGKGGFFLKKTAEEANIYLVWYNRKRGVYMFWGSLKNEVRDAMNRICGRIVKHVIHIPNENNKFQNQIADSPPPPALQQTNPPSTPMKLKQDDNNIMKSVEDISDDDDDDYYDMPELITHEEMLNENSKQKTFVDMSGGCLYNA